ncbi:hypothetical protein BgiBS90_016492, partial [Biomphalaria glabrata]
MSYPFEKVPPENCFDIYIKDELGLYRMLVNLRDSLQERDSNNDLNVCNNTMWQAPN